MSDATLIVLFIYSFYFAYRLGKYRGLHEAGKILVSALEKSFGKEYVADEMSQIGFANSVEKTLHPTGSSVRRLRIELVEDTLLLYDRISGDFVTQAKSVDELCKSAADHKHIDIATVMYEEEDKVIVFMHGAALEFTTDKLDALKEYESTNQRLS